MEREAILITVYHLDDSRSQRILWLFEELGLPYALESFKRNDKTRLAPPELEQIHPLGKSPIVKDGDLLLIESGAIVESIIRRHGKGRLAPPIDTPAYEEYNRWLHYAEGSAMLPLMLKLYVSRLKEAGAPLHPRINDETNRHIGYVNRSLEGRDYLLGSELSGADVQMSFVGEIVAASPEAAQFPNVVAWVKRFQARPAYQKALARGGPYRLAK